MTTHDYPETGARTTCCGRTAFELPMSDGRTTRVRDVNCDGKYESAKYAHEVYPHPSEYADRPPMLDHAVKYHLARACATFPAEFDGGSRAWLDQVVLALSERTTACLTAALHKGLSGQAALDWAHVYGTGDDFELLYDLAKEMGVELDRIRPYPQRGNLEATS